MKIGGFGTPESYTAASPYSLPADQEDKWKWMALELLHYLEQVDVTCFSEYTDVVCLCLQYPEYLKDLCVLMHLCMYLCMYMYLYVLYVLGECNVCTSYH